MNTLAIISIIIYTSLVIGACIIVTAERKSVLNVSGCVVFLSLAWWSFSNSFFFAATTQEQAWIWHKLSSIGWCGFVAITAYYFFAMTNNGKRRLRFSLKVLYFLPTIVLIVINLFGKTTSLAQNLTLTQYGWIYQNSIKSPLLWVYLAYVALYFGFAFVALYKWGKGVRHKMKKEMALAFIVLDVITILFGVVTDVILPLMHIPFPPLASIGTAFFAVGYFLIIYKNDVFNINLLISPDDILQTSNNSIFVTDENTEILKCNTAAGNLLGYNKTELIGEKFINYEATKENYHGLFVNNELTNLETKIVCNGGIIKDVLLSASIAKDKKGAFLCLIISCQDVTKQMKIQAELEQERKKYEILAHDYQRLAYFDPLTGMPNRRKFFEILAEFEKKYRAEKKDFAVIFLDLDNFKHANDVYGHQGGDELLIKAAQKLKACTAVDEFSARLGGDEFMVIIPYTEPTCIDFKLNEIRKEFSKSFSFDGGSYCLGITAGYSVFSQIGNSEMLMKKADEAMYYNKKGTFKHDIETR